MFISQQDDTPSIIKVHLLLSTKSQKNMIGRVAVISKRSKKKRKEKQTDSLTSLTVTLKLVLNFLVSW